MERVTLEVEVMEIPKEQMPKKPELLLVALHLWGLVRSVSEAVTLMQSNCVFVDRVPISDLNYVLPLGGFELIVGNRGVRVQ